MRGAGYPLVATLLFVECATCAVALGFFDWLVPDSTVGMVATLCSAAVLIGTLALLTHRASASRPRIRRWSDYI
jgi:uncharacterized membrane protein